MEKTCFKCNETKVIDEFYKHPQMKDGHLNKCKTCAKKDIQADYRADPLGHRAFEIKREQDPDRKVKKLEYQRRHRAKCALQTAARRMVVAAMKSGVLVPGPCFKCGSIEKVEGHHEDYAKPLEVLWLCRACHRELHIAQRSLT